MVRLDRGSSNLPGRMRNHPKCRGFLRCAEPCRPPLRERGNTLLTTWENTDGNIRPGGRAVASTPTRQNGDQFAQRRLAQIVQALEGQASSEVVAAVTTEVKQFAATRLGDDPCVVAAPIGEA